MRHRIITARYTSDSELVLPLCPFSLFMLEAGSFFFFFLLFAVFFGEADSAGRPGMYVTVGVGGRSGPLNPFCCWSCCSCCCSAARGDRGPRC